MRHRLREFYRPAALKKGTQRCQLDVRLLFGPLLGWVLQLLRPPEIVLALAPTLCRDRLAVLAVAVVAHGCAPPHRGGVDPVAWTAVRAGRAGAWMPHWLPMLERLHAVVPKRTRVIVLADRGLQSTDLFEAITALGWHPMIRLTEAKLRGTWRERGAAAWTKLSALPLTPGAYYLGRGHLFSTKPHACTLVAVWREGFGAPWLLMTDLAPKRCERAFYGLRGWIEQGFRCAKSGGLRCERMRIEDPERAERVWLVMAVSLLWTHAVGAAPMEAECFAEAFGSLPVYWRDNSWPADVQALGDAWLESERAAVLRVPSAVLPSESNYLVNPAHPDAERVAHEVVEVDPDPRLYRLGASK